MGFKATIYYCDPNKNLKCKQNGMPVCGSTCTTTMNKEYAVIGTKEKPVVCEKNVYLREMTEDEIRALNMAINERNADI